MRLKKFISIYFIYPVTFLSLGFCLNHNLSDGFAKEMFTDEEEKTEQAVLHGNMLVDADTRFIVKSFDLRDSSRDEILKTIPEKYIGMNRQDFLAAMDEYERTPSLDDRKKGFLSLDVERFSAEEIVIQKNYESAERNTAFYLAVENNYIVVYESDKVTRYMSTGIPIQILSEKLAYEIMDFKYIRSEAELYQFLESYSS